jgi:hypothetical protein
MGNGKITKKDVENYLALKRVFANIKSELEILDDEWLSFIPEDSYVKVGKHRICHKTSCKKTVSWKGICITKCGGEFVEETLKNAPKGKLSHSIEIKGVA